ncbi:MAG: hypothetical protein ACXABY_21690, partial [Candidatus Thorarchaeota archaeon]
TPESKNPGEPECKSNLCITSDGFNLWQFYPAINTCSITSEHSATHHRGLYESFKQKGARIMACRGNLDEILKWNSKNN